MEELRTAAVPPPPNLDTEDPPPTRPADLAAEVNQLRAAVQALTQERDSLRANRPEAAEGQPTQTMPTQTMLAVGPSESRNASDVMMATLIEEADTDLRRSQGRFAPY